ncbi:hypothetical protein M970_010260 [Encephalitozoon cuniculi EcunIII-L]|uniref:Uncharacterized protein n=1 Tax=Encephalitozoon cuniculi TaxID=6035 RepID=M1KLD7_ENCCN|nr:hypothetical protein ECU01_0440 [Encephalitozoon cuniculi]KMV66697.1 hypothetical protein M970_010260 [Encephalitozoon cuniculi EcunIII-L]
MRLYKAMALCLPLVVICTSEVSQSTPETMKSKAQDSYKRVVEHGKTCLERMCGLLSRGKGMLYTRVKNIVSSIRRGGEKNEEVAGPVDGEGSEEEAFDLSPEDIEKLIEEIKKKLAGYMDVTGEQNEEEEKKEL